MKTRPSRPIRCDVLIVEQMRYRQTNRLTDRASYRGALSLLKMTGESDRGTDWSPYVYGLGAVVQFYYVLKGPYISYLTVVGRSYPKPH